MADTTDVRVQLDGPHATFYLDTDAAREWWLEHVEEGPQWCGGYFVQGPYSVLLFDALVDAGFEVVTC